MSPPSTSKPSFTPRATPFARTGRRWHGIARAAGYVAAYAAWIAGFRMLMLTLLTYFLMSSNSKFQEISDAFGANELTLLGLGALLFVLLLRWLNPLTSTTTDEIFTPHRFEKRFLPGFLHGAVLAVGVTSAFLLSGFYKYLGFFIQFDEAFLAWSSVAIRIVSLGCLVYAEEFIFRHKVLNHLRREMPDLSAGAVTAVLYCGLKAVQFDLGVMQLMTLFLLSFGVMIRTVADGDFVRGAGFWAGLLVVFHPLLSLPAFGSEFQGVLLVKYELAKDDGNTARFLSGGVGGPLSSFALQLILLLDVAQGFYKNKKILLNARATR